MPLTRVWKMYEHWREQPPTHVLLASFLEYDSGKEKRESVSQQTGFAVTPQFKQAFGPGVPQSQLHPIVKKSVEEMQASPQYILWKKRLAEGRVA